MEDKSLKSILTNFITFKNNTFDLLVKSLQGNQFKEDYINDFMQFNWEIFVESNICRPGIEFLEIYGAGSDCNDPYSRVTYPKSLTTHKIVCLGDEVHDLLNNRIVDSSLYVFDKFVNFHDGFYQVKSPFNSVYLSGDNGDDAIVNFDDVEFVIRQLP